MLDISSTYFHSMSISRFQDTVNEYGITEQKYVPIPLLQLVPCGYSQSKREYNSTQTDNRNIIKYNPKIFCNPSLDIRAGDRIIINYNDRVIGEFTTSEPYIYDSHQEVPLLKVGEA